MTPTNKLRFVEREETFDGFSVDDHSVVRTVRVLQQWWEPPCPRGWTTTHPGSAWTGEWRDVPLEEEQ
jgi:hypothetical protein